MTEYDANRALYATARVMPLAERQYRAREGLRQHLAEMIAETVMSDTHGKRGPRQNQRTINNGVQRR